MLGSLEHGLERLIAPADEHRPAVRGGVERTAAGTPQGSRHRGNASRDAKGVWRLRLPRLGFDLGPSPKSGQARQHIRNQMPGDCVLIHLQHHDGAARLLGLIGVGQPGDGDAPEMRPEVGLKPGPDLRWPKG